MNFTITPHYVSHEGVTFLEHQGTYFKGCKRCGGAGHYSHNGDHSRCYACDNGPEKLGDHLGTLEEAQRWAHGVAMQRARAAAKREAERLAKQAKLDAKREAVKAIDAEVYEFIMALDVQGDYDHEGNVLESGTEKDEFLIAMWQELNWITKGTRTFTPRMVEATRKAMERRQAKAAEAAAHPAPVGRVQVTGEVVSTKVVEGDYGTTHKMLVKADEGYRVWSTIPTSLFDDEQMVGRRVSFTATLTTSRDDVSFAFGSRPTKAAWL